MNENHIPGVDAPMTPQNAVSVYSQDAMDDFPVLKAFQQYIDAEQAKARKRVLSLGIFFGILTGAIIAVFVVLLMNMTMRNQQLNDRLLEFAMKDRDRAPVVVQPAAPQPDSSAFLASLVAKLEALQGKIAESQAKKAEDAAKAIREEPPAPQAKPTPSAEALEIERLKAQLAAEREKAAVEKERRRQEELEEYRRKHYPELYRKPVQRATPAAGGAVRTRRAETADDEIEAILKEADDRGDTAITYFDDEEVAETPRKKAKPEATPQKAAPQKGKPAYAIPIDVKKPKRAWRIPAE